MKKIIFWKSEITGATGHGKPIEAALADLWVEWGNKEYPNVIHMAVDADVSKMAREVSEKHGI